MICSICGNENVIWMGPLSALTHTECPDCGGTNCQVPDDDAEGEAMETPADLVLLCCFCEMPLKIDGVTREGALLIERCNCDRSPGIEKDEADLARLQAEADAAAFFHASTN